MRLLWYVSRRSQPSTASPEVGMAFLISKWARMPMTSQVNGTKNGCIMKNFNKIFFAAVAAAFGLASCSQELTPVEKPQGNLVTVNFGAEASITCPTKATLTTEDEKLFTSAWENGDALSVKYSFDYGASKETTATWSADKSCFEAQMEGGNGVWIYDALYPTPKEVSFGSERTQNGSNYNGKYDLMYGSATAEGADAGKTADGKNIVFKMTRQTAVAYFHLTGTLDEDVVSAKLSVEGDGAYISTSDVKANEDYAKGYVFTETEGVASKEINLTFDAGTAPKASDFKLWFNVLPTKYTKMTLTVETAGHTMTISRAAADMYEAGKLYKVVKAIPAEKWVKKEAAVEIYNIITSETELEDGNYVICMALNSDLKNRQYLGNEKGTKPSTKAIVEKEGITISADLTQISVDPTKMKLAQWSFKKTTDGFSISSCSDASLGLGTTASNDGLTIQNTYFGKSWIISFDSTVAAWKLKYKDTRRFLNVYSLENPRTYTNETTNANGKIFLYKEGTPKTALETPANLQVSAAKVVSWDAVSGAASYEVTIGKDVFTSETTSYDAAAVPDEYYDVAVVAIPTDKENYKNSAAATLGGAKFGTPTLATPTLKEGVVDGASISVSWTVDERATAGYNCELFKGEVKVGEGQIVNAGTVTFTGLDAETAYVVKVNAVAVEGTKAYAASPVATLEVTTKAATATANDGSLERPYTAAEAIAAIDANTGLTGKYVKGIVKAAPSFDARYNSLTYDIESGAKTLNIYSGKDLGNAGFVGAEDLKAGDEVVVFGNLKKYNKVYELDKNNYLISINGETQIYRGLAVSAPKTAFTVGDAFEFGGKALQVWRGKADVDVTASATFSGYNMSTEGKQTVTVTVGEESVTYEINVRAAGAETPKTYTLQFGSEYNGAKANGYSNNWSVTCDGFTWKMTNWNNNNNGWTYVKAGPKGNTNAHAKIETAAAMPEAISKISITIDKVENGSITSIVLKSSSTNDFTAGTVIEKKSSVGQGEVVFEIPSPQNGLYYQLDFTLNNTTPSGKKGTNGVAQVSKVVYTNN